MLEKSLAVLGDGVIEDPAVLLAWRLPGLRPATSGLLARALSYPPVLCHPDAIHEDMVHSLPIRLLPTPPTCRMLPGSGVKLCVGRCGDVARDAEQGTEGVERIEPPVEAEGEFVEVGLQVLVTDPVMDAVQPRFQVCEDEMDDWQILLGDLRSPRSAMARCL